MERAITVLKNLPETKKEIKTFSEMVVNEILSGIEDPIKFEIRLKAIEEVIKKIKKRKDYQELLIDEIEKNNGKIELENAEISISNRATYNFVQCEDEKWLNLNAKLSELKEKIKEREDFLKRINYDSNVVDADTGAVIYPPEKTSKSVIVIKFK